MTKVSNMENKHELERELREAERAEAAPWTDYPPTPAWFPPLTGVWAALLVLAATTRDTHPVPAIIGLIVLIVVEMAFISGYRRYRGVMPSFKNLPAEFKPAVTQYVFAVIGVFGSTWLAFELGGTPGAMVASFLSVTALLWWYERTYTAAADAARKRLA